MVANGNPCFALLANIAESSDDTYLIFTRNWTENFGPS